jgi:hypothetical protein
MSAANKRAVSRMKGISVVYSPTHLNMQRNNIMSWSKNNDAHRTLWTFVRLKHRQSNGSYPKFAEGENWQADFLIKHVPGESPESKQSKASKFAHNFDGVARGFTGATYEQGYDYDSATKALSTALMDSSQTLGNSLGDLVDTLYQFLSEIDE